MATTKGSDNRFPLVRLTYEDDTPATPPADEGHIVVGVDKVLRFIDDTGTVTALGSGTVDYGEDADITDQAYDDVADAGVLDEVARADHLHGMPSAGGGGGGGGGLTLPLVTTYSSDTLDGVFTYLGLQKGTTYVNPSTYGTPTTFGNGTASYPGFVGVTATQSTNQDGTRTADKALDRSLDGTTGCTHTTGAGGEWWKVDFGSGHTFDPTHLAIIGRASGGYNPRNFDLEGSNDNSAWTTLLTVTADGPADNSWWDAAVTGSAAYRYLRIAMTGANEAAQSHLVLGEVEMWGTLT